MDAEQRIYSADDARALREAAEEFVELPLRADTFRGAVVVSDDTDFGKVATVEVGDKGMNTAVAMIFAAAPDLAASVEHHAARADAAEAEARRLRAIIEGRTVPSATEIPAHEAQGGRWLVGEEGRFLVVWGGRALALADFHREYHPGARWWSLDGTGRLCAWPVAAADGAM